MKKDALYIALPKVFQEMLLSTYSINRNAKRFSSAYLRYKEFFMESYYWDNTKIKNYQTEKLKQLLDYARNRSSYYSRVLKDVEINEVSDINKLPILTKKILKSNLDQIYVRQDKKTNKFYTSGTTGTPLHFELTDDEWSKENALIWRHRELLGIKRGDKLASFIGRTIVKPDEKETFWRYNYADKQLLFSSYHMQDYNLDKYIEKYNLWKSDFVQGYPSLIYLIAKHADVKNIKLHKPKSIFTSSETLLDYQRDTIEKVFNSKIFDYYGSTERAGVITQCNHGKYHVNIESGILEIIDGRFYWTSFINWTTPLIRYEIGDTGSFSFEYEKCGCGSYFPTLETIEGRVEDYVYTKDKRPLGRLDHIFKGNMGVKEAQLVQNELGIIDIYIVPDKMANTESLSNEVVTAFRKRIGDQLDVRIRYVENIDRSSNGKFKFVVSKLRNDSK